MTMERKKSKLKMIQKLQLHHQYQAHPQEMDGLFLRMQEDTRTSLIMNGTIPGWKAIDRL